MKLQLMKIGIERAAHNERALQVLIFPWNATPLESLYWFAD